MHIGNHFCLLCDAVRQTEVWRSFQSTPPLGTLPEVATVYTGGIVQVSRWYSMVYSAHILLLGGMFHSFAGSVLFATLHATHAELCPG